MSKFGSRPSNVRAPVASSAVPDTRTHEGAAGYTRDARSALFLLAASNFVTETSFYESAGDRDARFEQLIHDVTREDPGWVRRFGPYLRGTMHMRSASIVLAAEYVKAGGELGRSLVNAVLQRPDEPGEMLAYWTSRHGRNVPKPIKRGVADAVQRLYNERAVIKWDGGSHAWRFADVIELVHPKPVAPWQGDLFRYLLDNRHHGDGSATSTGEVHEDPNTGWTDAIGPLATIAADRRLLALPESARRAAIGSADWDTAGWSWERLAGWIPGGMDAAAWEAVIPQMGYMALLRNLRNFDDAGISDDTATAITVRLTNPDEVAKSRQFPYRFYSAYKAIPGLRWAYPLERALTLSLDNVPALSGRTLVMVDVSGSMTHESYLQQFHPRWRAQGRNKSTLPWEMAAVFGVALAMKANAVNGHADVVAYGSAWEQVQIQRGAAILKVVDSFKHTTAWQTGTATLQIADHLTRGAGYDRLVILTDEQTFAGAPADALSVPLVYTFNMAGYAAGHLPSGEHGRYTFGGLTDAAFDLLPALEGRADGRWPF